MVTRDSYDPGPADLARVEKDGESWTLVLVRQFRHSPQTLWKALTDPNELAAWAPFDADRPLDQAGASVKLTTVGAPQAGVSNTLVTRAEAPHLLQYNWGDREMKWQLESVAGGTRLTLWANIDRNFIAMGAAGWHICLDVLDYFVTGQPLGRLVAGDALKFGGWQRLHAEYAHQFGLDRGLSRSTP